MSFELKKGKKKSSLILKDSVDISEARDIVNAVKQSKGSDIEVCMRDVSFMDASIVQLLVAIKMALKDGKKSLQIKNRSEEAEKVIRLVGAAEVLA